jgi:hypothetical protein
MNLRKLIDAEPNIQRPKNVSDSQWNKALELYVAAKNVGDKFPELTVAQAVLETGWFKKESGKNNFFGQKATKSQRGSSVVTHEVYNGNKKRITDRFRDYDSIEESLQDRKNKWMSKYKDAATTGEAIDSIWKLDENKKQGRGYATDPEYGNKINTILGMMGVQEGTTTTEGQITSGETPEKSGDTPITGITPANAAITTAGSEGATYASIESEEKVKETKGITEAQVRDLLAKERDSNESKFIDAFSQQSKPEQDYIPQQREEDLSHLYNYIDIENYADGGTGQKDERH